MYSIPSLRGILSETGPAPVTGPFPFYTNGSILSQSIVGNDIYIGGTFTSVGANKDLKVSKFCNLNSTNANLNLSSINKSFFDDAVVCSVISGSYIYVGGYFTVYNNQPCQRLAKISLIDGSLDTTFNTISGFDGAVLSIALDGSGNLYAGGVFTTYKGTTRQYIAKVNGTTAALDTTFDAASGFNQIVRSIALDSSGNLYAGGVFSAYKGSTRQRIAKVNATTAALDATFNSVIGFNSGVTSIALDGSGNLYAGGQFSTYKGTARNRIAKLNASTADLDTTFDSASGFNSDVNSIFLDSSGNVYAGGGFTTYKVATRQYIAKLNVTTAALDTTFDAASGFDVSVTSIYLDGSGGLYVGGGFNSYKGTTRQAVAKINATTAALDTTFNSASGCTGSLNYVYTFSLGSSDNLYIGGYFTDYKAVNQTVSRQNIAKISLLTGNIDTTFNAASAFNSSVYSIALDGSGNLYSAGAFTTYKGTTRQYIAKINATTAALDTTFNSASGFSNSANVIKLDGSGNLYVGGNFTTYKGTTRQNIAKINATTAALDTTFDSASGFNALLTTLALDGSGNLYVGGLFTAYKGTTRQYIAKINATTAALDTTFDSASGFNDSINIIVLDGSDGIYVGGSFLNYKGTARRRIAKLNATTAALNTTFDTATGFGSFVSAIALDGSGNLYAGGFFSDYKGTTRQYIAKLNATTAALNTTFDSVSGFNQVVKVISLDSSGNLYVGGDFTGYKTFITSRAAIIDTTTAAAKGY